MVFGDLAVYGTNNTASDEVLYLKANLAIAGTVIRVRVYIDCVGVAPMKCAIYRVSDGVKMCESVEVNVPVGVAWVNFALTSPVALAAGNYYLAVWTDDGTKTRPRRASAAGLATLYYAGHVYGAWPDPVGVVVDTFVSSMSVFALGAVMDCGAAVLENELDCSPFEPFLREWKMK